MDWRFSTGGIGLYAVAIYLGIMLTPETWPSPTVALQTAYLCLLFSAAGIALVSFGLIREHSMVGRVDMALFSTGWLVAIAGFVEWGLIRLDANYAQDACPGLASLNTVGRCLLAGPFTIAEYSLAVGLASPIMAVVGLLANKRHRT